MTDKKNAADGGQPSTAGTAANGGVQTIEASIAQSIPDGKTAEFLAHLHRGGLWAYYWTPDGEEYIKDGKTERHKESIWYSTKRGQRLPAHWADRRNCYFGVHPTKEAGTTSQRSTKNTVSAVNCFYAEFDAKDFPNKQAIPDHLDASLAAYRAGVGGFPYPSVIVDSGGGYHCYWLLEHTVTLTDENRNIVARIQAAWVDVVGGDGGAKDLPRVLRIPGTQNRKPEYGPNFPTVHFVEYNLGRLYLLSDFETLTFDLRNKTLKPAQTAHQTAQYGQGATLPGDGEVWDVLFSGPYGEDARRLYDGDLSAHGGDHSKADYALCKHLAYILGDDPSAIDRLFCQSALLRDKWADRADYRDATISKAIGSTSKHFDWAKWQDYQERKEAAKAAQDLAHSPTAQHNTNGTGQTMNSQPGQQSTGATSPHPDAMPELPESARLPDSMGAGACRWLDEYERFSRLWSPRAWDDFHAAAGLWILSTIAARRVMLPFGGQRFTNLYFGLTATTTIHGKTTTSKIAGDAIRAAGLDHLLIHGDSTPQAFVQALATNGADLKPDATPDTIEKTERRLLFAGQRGWMFEEFGGKVSAMMRDGSVMSEYRALMLRFDDCDQTYEYRTISRGTETIQNPYLALLANVTPAYLQPFAGRGAPLWADGFFARFVFLTSPETNRASGAGSQTVNG